MLKDPITEVIHTFYCSVSVFICAQKLLFFFLIDLAVSNILHRVLHFILNFLNESVLLNKSIE